MSEMGDWINQMALSGVLTRPPNENPIYGDPVTNAPPGTVLAEKPMLTRPPGEVPMPVLQEMYGVPQPPAAPAAGVSPELADFLRYYSMTGNGTISPEMYQHFNGDNILASLRAYDPNAAWADVAMGGGEGGMGPMGRRLDFDASRLPVSGSGIDLLNMRPEQFGSAGLHNENYVYNDPIYGRVTHSSNVNMKHEGIEKYAPYIAALISMGGPAAAGALAAAGIGAGAAGATSLVTGGAAGLGAANIPGAAAAAAAGGAAPTSGWWGRAAGRLPQQAGSMLSGAPSSPTPPRPVPRPPVPRATPDMYGFDPSAFGGAGGSVARPQNNDSSLVATQFADDPYGFSKGFA